MKDDSITMSHSSSLTGFFQAKPKLKNQIYEDRVLNRILKAYLPSEIQHAVVSDLSSFGDCVLSDETLSFLADAERHPPTLQTWDTFGKRQDKLLTSEGWRALQRIGIKEGIVAIPYVCLYGPYNRVYQFIKYHIWSASSAYVICPSAMTDGAASLLGRSLASGCLDEKARSVLRSAFQRLISRDEDWAWTSGQWMTERGGGSDVAGTETVATYASQPLSSRGVDGSSLGPYSISGFKWFSSATDANMSVLLAKTTDDKLSAFYAPMRRTVPNDPKKTELNGITIQRLKNKLGTKALPTAELQLSDTRAYLLGDYGRGVKEISTVLNITRVHNAVTAVGLWGRGLAISRAFARVRRIGKRQLCNIPAHVKTMAKQQIEYAAYMHLTFFTVLLLGITEHEKISPSTDSHNASILTSLPVQRLVPVVSHAPLLLRLLTPVIKGLTAKASIAGLNECMESLGGVGYLENEDLDLNIARLFRDACVLSIWEGTTDVMATDMLKVVKGKQSDHVLEALERWLSEILENTTQVQEEVEVLRNKCERWMRTIRSGNLEQLTINGRGLMKDLGGIVAGVLLVKDAEDTKDRVTCEVLRRWVIADDDTSTDSAWHDTHAWNQKIVFGTELTAERSKL